LQSNLGRICDGERRLRSPLYYITQLGISQYRDILSCYAFKLGISSEQDAKPAAWLR